MKKSAMLLWLLVVSVSLYPQPANSREQPRQVNALVLLGEWFGDAYFPLKDEIEARGWTMKRISTDSTYRGCFNKKRDVLLTSEIFIPDLKDFSGYNCLIIPSGPQFRKFIVNPTVLQCIRDAHTTGLVIASFCTGNWVVEAAGLVDFENDAATFPQKVTGYGDRILIGPKGGGPPPGNGYKSAPIKEICDAIGQELTLMKP